jgi:hypothetical protein
MNILITGGYILLLMGISKVFKKNYFLLTICNLDKLKSCKTSKINIRIDPWPKMNERSSVGTSENNELPVPLLALLPPYLSAQVDVVTKADKAI